MRHLKIVTVVASVVSSLAGGASVAAAATAHNSQAGSWGPTSRHCAPTPYFRQGGCLTSYFIGRQPGTFDPPLAPGRNRRLAAPPED